ncbi:MAG: hypothetical protein ACXVLQ_04225 [Bacteriovorax sp.]
MKNHFTVFMAFLCMSNSFASYTLEDVKKIKNDKEVLISSFSKREKDRVLEKFKNVEARERLSQIFYSTVLDFINDDNNQCEADFQERLEESLTKANLAHDKESIDEYLKLLRSTNSIDDVLFDILTALNEDTFKMKKVDLSKKAKWTLFSHKKRLEKNTLEDIYWRFKSWPDEKTKCSTQEFIRLKESIVVPKDNEKEKEKFLGTLNLKAYQKDLISLETYNKLEFLRTKSNVNKRYIWLNDYFKIIFNAKDAMRPLSSHYEVKNFDAEDKFSSERIKRFSKLTRRKRLYEKYNETQIILLAQVLQKASRRMGVDPDTITNAPVLVQEFSTLNSKGERETYVEKTELDPQSQYNLARRLMRKDILNLQMMGIFNKTNITYEDLVMASFEVGYISLEDIEFVVKYDDLWNPTTTKYERISKFIYSIVGYSTFFLPPPWNITASIALGVIEGVIDNNHKNGAENDNPGTFIE